MSFIAYPDTNDPQFYEKLYWKKEFHDNTYHNYKPALDGRFHYFPHQKFIKYLISPYSPYNGILLYHAVGTGKTCSAISIAESFIPYLRKNTNNLILLKGDTIKNQFMANFKTGCTGDRYLNESEREFLKYARTHKGQYVKEAEYINIKANRGIENNERQLKGHYVFMGHKTFTNRVFGIGAKSAGKQKRIKPEDFNNAVVIVDEVHYAQKKGSRDEYNLYDALQEFLKRAKGVKLVLLTATPNFNEPYEIADIINLLRLNDNKPLMPTGNDFMKLMYGIDNYKATYERIFAHIGKVALTASGKKAFANYTRGYISYLSGYDPKTYPRIQYEGVVGNGMQQLKVISCPMQPFQQKYYDQAYIRDKSSKGKVGEGAVGASKKNTIYASNFAIPVKIDGVYKYDASVYKNLLQVNAANGKEVVRIKDPKMKPFFKMPNLRKFSAKYAALLDNITQGPGKEHNIFIFNMEIVNTGANYVNAVLKENGWFDYAEGKKVPGKNYAVIIGDSTKTYERNVLSVFNSPQNKDGKLIKILIGTEHLREGIDLKNTTQIHIMDPWWNLSQNDQVIGRAMRAYAHQDLPPAERVIHVYQYVASFMKKRATLSEDEHKYYFAECKDILSKRITYEAKITAVDCFANKPVNMMSTGFVDGSRMCDYNKCAYTCAYEPTAADANRAVDRSTYVNLWRKELIYAIKLFIKGNLFKQKMVEDFATILKTVKARMPAVNEGIVADALYDMIINKDAVYDSYGREGYLVYRDQVFVFTPIANTPNDSLYVRNLVYKARPSMTVDDWITGENLPMITAVAKKKAAKKTAAEEPAVKKVVKSIPCKNEPMADHRGQYDRFCRKYGANGKLRIYRPTTGNSGVCGTGNLSLVGLADLCKPEYLNINWKKGLKYKGSGDKDDPKNYTGIPGSAKDYMCGLIESCLHECPADKGIK